MIIIAKKLRTGKRFNKKWYSFEQWSKSKAESERIKKSLKKEGYSVRTELGIKGDNAVFKIFKRKK